MGDDMFVAIVWVAVALALWIHFKIVHRNDPVLPDGPPQRTFIGSLMWPFYLAAYLWNEIKATFQRIIDGMDDEPPTA